MGVALICLSFLPTSPTGCHSPLSTLGRRQDGIRQGHLAVRQPRSCPVIWLVGKENIVIHAAKEEGREGDDKHKLSEMAESAIITLRPRPQASAGLPPHKAGPLGRHGGGAGWTRRSRHYRDKHLTPAGRHPPAGYRQSRSSGGSCRCGRCVKK